MAIEIRRPKEDRGAKWVWAQAVLFILYILAPYYFNTHFNTGLQGFGVLMMGWGGMFAAGAFVTMGRQHGWKNITPFPKPRRNMTLLTDGAFAYVRHPIYFGIILMLVGYSFYSQNSLKLIVSVAIAVLLDFKTKKEEAFLNIAYPQYAAYTKKTKRLIPGLL